MAQTLKVGDVVELKSGGPKMTVVEIGTGPSAGTIWCKWFIGYEPRIDSYDAGTIVIATD
jgi:uncharacterized protein YodC (DUF2158 family)